MAFPINEYPYTDAHELNMDYVLHQLSILAARVANIDDENVVRWGSVWDVTKDYKIYTIVYDNDNNLYISIDDVNPGVTLDDATKWKLVSENFSQDIYNINNELLSINAAIASLDLHKRYVFLGDSYNYYGGGWISGVKSAMGLTNADVFDYTVSGHGFYVDGSPSLQWITDITSFVNSHPDDVATITDIVCVGGLNDALASESDLTDAVNAFCSYVKSNIPNAKVTMIYVGGARKSSPVLYGRDALQRTNSINIINTALSHAGGIMVKGSENSLFQYTCFGSDELHPSAEGCKNIVTSVVQGLLTGSVNFELMTQVATPVGGYYLEIIDSGRASLVINLAGVGALGTVISGAKTAIATLPNEISSSNFPPITAWLDSRSISSSQKIPVTLYIENRTIYASAAYTTSTSAYESYTLGQQTFIVQAQFETSVQDAM